MKRSHSSFDVHGGASEEERVLEATFAWIEHEAETAIACPEGADAALARIAALVRQVRGGLHARPPAAPASGRRLSA